MQAKSQAASGRPAFEGLPSELSEFLSRDTYSLLVKGESGTGKTILALSILKSLLPIDNLLYLSTRTSPLQLVENYPWVEEIFGQPNAMNAGGKREAEGWGTLVDARLDEPNVVFERITNVLMDKEAPTVVIDSWESLSDALGTEALRTNIKVLQTWRERAGARFIFVGEDPANTTIDFMVEGVVTLKDRVEQGRRLREMVLSKLHGVQISRPSYFFTLKGGTFESVPGYSPRDYEFRNPIPVRFNLAKGKSRAPTGYAPLDAHLGGGLPLKSKVVVEVDRKVEGKVGLIFLSRAVQGSLARGWRVLIQRPADVDRRFMAQYVKSFSAGKEAAQLADEGKESGPYRKDRSAKKIFEVTSESEGDRKGAGSGAERVADVEVVLSQRGDARSEASAKPATWLRLTEIEGTLFLQCEVPPSAFFAVIPGTSGGNPMMRLEPVV